MRVLWYDYNFRKESDISDLFDKVIISDVDNGYSKKMCRIGKNIFAVISDNPDKPFKIASEGDKIDFSIFIYQTLCKNAKEKYN